MTDNWIRPPRAERRPRWKLRLGFFGFVVLFVGSMVVLNLAPSDVSVGSNIGPTPCDQMIAGACARHLTPTTTAVTTRPTPVPTKAPTTTVTFGPSNPSDFLLIDGGQVLRIPRTPETTKLLWLASVAYG